MGGKQVGFYIKKKKKSIYFNPALWRASGWLVNFRLPSVFLQHFECIVNAVHAIPQPLLCKLFFPSFLTVVQLRYGVSGEKVIFIFLPIIQWGFSIPVFIHFISGKLSVLSFSNIAVHTLVSFATSTEYTSKHLILPAMILPSELILSLKIHPVPIQIIYWWLLWLFFTSNNYMFHFQDFQFFFSNLPVLVL